MVVLEEDLVGFFNGFFNGFLYFSGGFATDLMILNGFLRRVSTAPKPMEVS